MNSDTRKTLTVEEVAEALGVSRTSAYALARSGVLPVLRVGKRIVIPRAAFEKFLENPPASAPPKAA
jgi:excisionase family DNA binding protein